MKMHTPLFVVGLLTFVTPFLGIPSDLKMIILAAYGIAIMLLVSSLKLMRKGGESIVSESNRMDNPKVEETSNNHNNQSADGESEQE